MALPSSPSASSVEADEAAEVRVDDLRVDDLVEDVSIDGMCGVY